jgi:uncharacterized protein YidB (DUF937 family)
MSESQQQDLGGMLRGLLGGQGGGGVAKLLPAVLGMVGGAGGVGGLLSKLQQGGLGEQAKSWVSPQAANAPVSGQQVTEALGQDKIDELAKQAQVSPQEAAEGLATVLPTAVDNLTPQGEVPKEAPKLDVGQLQQQLAKLLGNGR